jgi:hypothetical protein
MRPALAAFVTGLGLCLSIACQDSPAPTNEGNGQVLLSDTASTVTLSGQVVDADSLPAQRARILLYFLGPVPPDTVPPDTTPPDSTPPDTLPPPPDSLGATNDIIRIVQLSGDSVPGDTTPPPPPPCGDRGELVSRSRADGDGFFQVSQLAPGVYDVRASAEGQTGQVCGQIVRDSMFVAVMLAPRD